jgi:hypothetical protein
VAPSCVLSGRRDESPETYRNLPEDEIRAAKKRMSQYEAREKWTNRSKKKKRTIGKPVPVDFAHVRVRRVRLRPVLNYVRLSVRIRGGGCQAVRTHRK